MDGRFRSLKARPWLVDGVIALALLALGLGYHDIRHDVGPGAPWEDYPSYWLGVAVVVAMIAPVAFRWRAPLTSLAVGASAVLLGRLTEVPEIQASSIALFLLIYSAGASGGAGGRNPVRALAAVEIGLALAFTVYNERIALELDVVSTRAYVLSNVIGLAFNAAFVVAAWLLGDAARQRVEREQELAAANLELAMSREENERRAVLDERVRISREVHDVVAHHVSVMGVQAGAARRVFDRSPDDAAAALQAIEESSREAVSELQRLLGFLRSGESETDDAAPPLPGLGQLGHLRRQVANAGLAVRLTDEGEAAGLPPSIDLSAYRIVQEGLTNTLKHAGVQEAEVVIERAAEELRVTVRDRGRGPLPRDVVARGGRGLAGMKERVALHGGTLRHGRRVGGGFELVAVLPHRVPAEQSR